MSVIIDGSAGVTTNVGAVYNGLQSGTAVASTSGTSIDFTSIPSWVKRITVMFSGVSTNGTSQVQVQLGTSSGIVTSGYLGTATVFATNAIATANTSSGFQLYFQVLDTAAAIRHGQLIISNVSGNVWVGNGNFGLSNSTYATAISAGISLASALDRVRITTIAPGTDLFDAGSINIMYE